MKIKISSDSTCDLSSNIIEKYQIGIVPLYITCGGKPYKDGLEITPDEIFAHVESGGDIGSTAAVNIQDYANIFSEYLKECDAVIHFTISSDMSCCFQNARAAAETLKNVYVVDSMNLSTGIGQLVLDAAEMAQKGMTAQEIVQQIEIRKTKLDVSFVLDTLDYLAKGGRCSSIAAFGANMIRLKPSIEVQGGKMGVGRKYRGPLGRCLKRYINDKLADPNTVDPRRIFITDSGIDEELRKAVEDEVLSHVKFEEVIHTRAGCTISNHCGPNCIGILFFRK